MRLVLLHYHILKNAGTTIEEILYRNFLERLCRFDTPDRNGEFKNADLISYLGESPDVTAFSSHQIYYPVPQAPGFLFFDLCFLRDPIDRIRSMYDFFRQKPSPGDPISDLANEQTPGGFSRYLIDHWPWTINDVQVNLLAHGPVKDQPRPGDLEKATERMLETSFLGVVDCFNQSLIAGQYGLRTVFPELIYDHPAVNVSSEGTLEQRTAKFREGCEPAVYEELLRLNAMDFALLESARAEVRRRFDLVPDGAARLRAIEERVKALPAAISAVPRQPPVTHDLAQPSIPTKLRRLIRMVPHLRALPPWKKRASLFDPEYYQRSNPGVHPWLHFVTIGAFRGRNPNPLFDMEFYLQTHPELAAAKSNPLAHYLNHGEDHPNPLFDPNFYLTQNPDVRQSGTNPLLHYMLYGTAEGRKPHPLFQPGYYLAQCLDANLAGKSPLLHFLDSDPKACVNPHLLFDCESYSRENPGTGNALARYLRSRPQE